MVGLQPRVCIHTRTHKQQRQKRKVWKRELWTWPYVSGKSKEEEHARESTRGRRSGSREGRRRKSGKMKGWKRKGWRTKGEKRKIGKGKGKGERGEIEYILIMRNGMARVGDILTWDFRAPLVKRFIAGLVGEGVEKRGKGICGYCYEVFFFFCFPYFCFCHFSSFFFLWDYCYFFYKKKCCNYLASVSIPVPSSRM